MFRHVLINVKSVDDWVEFESHLIVLTPLPYFVQVVKVAFLPLGSANGSVGVLIKAVAGDCKNVQVLSLKKREYTDYTQVRWAWMHATTSNIYSTCEKYIGLTDKPNQFGQLTLLLVLCRPLQVYRRQRTIFLEPSLLNHASVAHNADTGKLKLVFTVSHHLTQEVASLMQERLSTRKVYFFHSCKEI